MQQNPDILEAAAQATSVLTQSPAEIATKGKAIKKSGKRIGYNYIVLKSLKESQKNDVVKCLYIKSLTNFGICVIKEGTYGDSKDKEGRDIKDKLVWQKQLHEMLQDKVRLPRYLGSFEENGNYYLVIERIKGKSLYKAYREKSREIREGLITGNKLGMAFLDYMIQLAGLLDSMHKNQVLHRDVSANNFIITPSGKVAIIDLEMGYILDKKLPFPPFQLGTYGYMSPQQETMKPPAVTDDIFSAGAIMLQIWTGISPSKITNAPIAELSQKIHFFVPDRNFAAIILQCLQPEPEKRPALDKVREVISEYKRDLQLKRKRTLSKTFSFSKEEIIDTIQRSIHTLASPLLADAEKGWFSEDRNKPVPEDKKKINKEWYTSFNKGATGVLYTLARAKQMGFDTSANISHIQKTLELVEKKYISKIDKVSSSLHFGSPGIAAALAIAIHEKLFEPQSMHFEWINQLISVENKKMDYMDGIAGQGMAHWLCNSFIHEGQMQERLADYVARLIEIQQKNGSWINGKPSKKNKTIKGFARGAAGIIYFLLEYAMQCQERDPLNAAKRGLEWLMKTSVYRKGTIQWLSSAKKEILPSWNEGAPGIALAFMKGYSLLGEEKYKKYAHGALLSTPRNILDNSLGQARGLSGLGEIYLEAYKIFNDAVWLERAGWITQVIMQMKKEHKDHGPYWLVEHERQPLADFMNGNSGVIHFLLRYFFSKQIPFPMLGK